MTRTLTKSVLLAVLAAALQASFPATAEAQVLSAAEGRRCNFSSVSDPTLEGDAQTGQINGGPLVATAPAATIQMTCTIQVGVNTHNGEDACAPTGPVSIQVGFVPPTLCTYDAPPGVSVYICSQATINGVTYYWDAGPPDPGTGTWSTSSASYCNEGIETEIFPGPLCTMAAVLYGLLGGDGDWLYIDNIAAIDPYGDLYVGGIGLFIDCAPRPTDPPPAPPGGWFPSDVHDQLFPHPPCSQPVELHCMDGSDKHCALWIAGSCAPLPEPVADTVTLLLCLRLI